MDDEGAHLRAPILETPSPIPQPEDHAVLLQHQFDILV